MITPWVGIALGIGGTFIDGLRCYFSEGWIQLKGDNPFGRHTVLNSKQLPAFEMEAVNPVQCKASFRT